MRKLFIGRGQLAIPDTVWEEVYIALSYADKSFRVGMELSIQVGAFVLDVWPLSKWRRTTDLLKGSFNYPGFAKARATSTEAHKFLHALYRLKIPASLSCAFADSKPLR